MTQEANSKEETPLTGFLSHLLELRDRLLRMAMVTGVVFIALFPFAQDLYHWLAGPVLAQGQNMIATGPIAPIFVPYKVALLTAFLISLPYIFYQVWAFVAPGLYKHEKRLIVPLLSSSVALFYVGIAFAYFLLLPMVFKVVQVMTPVGVDAIPDISAYLDFVMMIFIAFGFGFEMPIATILVVSTGMISAKDLAKKRPYVIVGAFIVGMLLTPPDVVSQLMLAIPMWLLFEIGLFLSKYFVDEVKAAGRARDRLEMKEREEEEADRKMMASATAAAAAGGAAAAVTASASDSDSDDNTSNDTNTDKSDNSTDNDSEHRIMWEDEKYVYEDDSDVNLDDEEEYVPMTDEEMEAELDRIEAEERAEEERRKQRIAELKAQKDQENKDNKDDNKT